MSIIASGAACLFLRCFRRLGDQAGGAIAGASGRGKLDGQRTLLGARDLQAGWCGVGIGRSVGMMGRQQAK